MHVNIGKVVLGGFVGTVVMTIMMYVVSPMMGLKMDVADMLGSMLGIGWTMGMILHFVNGTIIFPALYAFVLYRWLPGSPTVKGATWGIILWLLAQTMVMPMAGAGFFSAAMGGMMAVVGSLVGHLLYGALLGVIAGDVARPHVASAHA
jgi:hypothetical protein